MSNVSRDLERIKKLTETGLKDTSQVNSVLKEIKEIANTLVLTDELVLSRESPQGAKILTENKFFRDLLILVRTKEFREFYSSHMNTSVDMMSSLVYIELNSIIENLYQDRFDTRIGPEMAALMLKTLMSETKFRRPLMKVLISYVKGETRKNQAHDTILFYLSSIEDSPKLMLSKN